MGERGGRSAAPWRLSLARGPCDDTPVSALTDLVAAGGGPGGGGGIVGAVCIVPKLDDMLLVDWLRREAGPLLRTGVAVGTWIGAERLTCD